MSFKRDGDDHSLLQTLQRRRVGDLLSKNIPNDEALLLKNGRYACTVCRHKPIFDTMSTLALHRKSKRHLENLTFHLQKQKELNELIQRRKQEQFLKTGSSKLVIGRKIPSNASLTPQPAYSSCIKKKIKKGSKFDRKQVVDIIVDNKASSAEIPKVNNGQSAKSLVRSYLKDIQKKKDFGAEVEKARRNFGRVPASWHNSNQNKQSKADSTESVTLAEQNKTTAPETSTTTSQTETSPVDKERANYYLNLRARGWKKDLSGNWIKDEDAEFDSDEEQPVEYT